MKSTIRLLATAVLCVLWIGAALTSCSPQPIILGFQGPLTGTTADLGVQGRNGAILSVETINAAGGVEGRPLQLDPRDDRNDPRVARNLVEEFRQDGVEVVIGPMTSVAGVAIAERVADAGPLYVSPTVSTVKLSGRDDFFFRLEGATDHQAKALGEFTAASAVAHRVVVVSDTSNSEYSLPYAEAFAEGVAAEGGVVLRILAVPLAGTSSWNPLIEAVEDEQPDAVLIVASAADTARFAQAIRSADLNWSLLASGWAATDSLFTLGGTAVEDMLLARPSYSALTDTKRGTDFRNRFFRRFGKTPSFAASQAYDAVRLVAQALETARPTAEDLRQELSSVDSYDTVLGPVTFDGFGDIEPSAMIVRVEQGRFVQVAGHSARTGSQQ